MISDIESKVAVFTREDDRLNLVQTISGHHSEESSIIDGSSEKATLEEPVDVSFVGISIYICCFRTGLKLCSNIAFALRYSQEMQKVYIAIGFKPKSSKEMLPKYSFKRNACPLCNPSTGVDANCWIRNTF